MVNHLEVITEEPDLVTHQTPILFVHGMWHAAWCWSEHFMPYFSQQGYRTHALSLRGHGDSDGHDRLRWSSIRDYVADVAEVAGQFDTPPVAVGHSMGGMVVQKYLETHQAPAAVLLASGSPTGLLPGTIRFLCRHPLAFMKINLTFSLSPVVATQSLVHEGFYSADMPEEMVKVYYERLQDESFRAYVDLLGLNLPNPKRVKSPLLVLGAENDKMISSNEVIATGRAYGTKSEIFSGMAHNMMLETGWKKVAERMLSWFDEQGL
jgi:pimeloyl-ACP methyl ester carboxylesterase